MEKFYTHADVEAFKDSVDFLIVTWGVKKVEIKFNKPTILKTNRSIEQVNDCVYFVSKKALEQLKQTYSWSTDM